MSLHYTKKRSFPLMISSVNVTRSAGTCEFVQITQEIFKGKLRFFSAVLFGSISAALTTTKQIFASLLAAEYMIKPILYW